MFVTKELRFAEGGYLEAQIVFLPSNFLWFGGNKDRCKTGLSCLGKDIEAPHSLKGTSFFSNNLCNLLSILSYDSIVPISLHHVGSAGFNSFPTILWSLYYHLHY